MFSPKEDVQKMLNHRVAVADSAHPIDAAHPVKCPGESTIARRRKSMAEGVQVDDTIWEQVCAIAEGKSLSGHIE